MNELRAISTVDSTAPSFDVSGEFKMAQRSVNPSSGSFVPPPPRFSIDDSLRAPVKRVDVMAACWFSW
jgi:hypothetical protein